MEKLLASFGSSDATEAERDCAIADSQQVNA